MEKRFDSKVRVVRSRKLFGLAILVGILSGVAAVSLAFLIDLFTFIAFRVIGGVEVVEAPGIPSLFGSIDFTLSARPLLLAIPIIGGLIIGYIIYHISPEVEGSGLDQVMTIYHNERGKVRKRVPLVTTLSSAITIGVGGSAGKEGPSAEIGGSIGSIVADRFRLTSEDREILLLTGAAACLGAIFKSPFGAALFIIEILYAKDYEVEAFIYCIIATFISYGIFSSVFGWVPLFSTPTYGFIPQELPLFVLLGLACAFVAVIFIKVFLTIKNRIFSSLQMPKYLKPAVGMVLISLLLVFFPYATGPGYGQIQMIIDGVLPVSIILMMAGMKILSTSFTIGSGNSGGAFAPSLVIGASIGGMFGLGTQLLFTTSITQSGIFVVIGMGAFVSAIANAPIAAIIMVSEMTGSYAILPAAILASVTAYIATLRWSLYEPQLPDRTYSYARIPTLMYDLLSHVEVKKIMTSKFHKILDEAKVVELEELCISTGQKSFPVMNNEGDIIGVVGCKDISEIPREKREIEIVREITKTDFVSVFENFDLRTALHELISMDLSQIPVLDSRNRRKLLGVVRRADIEKIMEL